MVQDALSVSELTGAIKDVLQQAIGDVVVIGEVSNYKRHSSGHRYFSLKDDDASIASVMWRTRTVDFEPEDGMQVLITGRLTVYAPQGRYQIDVSSMRPAGLGALQRILEERKRELAARGFFDWQRKRELPAMPLVVGVVTSATGAALQDILSTIRSRFPIVHVIVRPALVQGQGAAEDVARAIYEMQASGADVLIVGRGGGSIEDLWAFNEVVVAEAIFNSSIPVISAVGHETDDTIADLVADVRAATPTQAAVLATPVTRDDMILVVAELRDRCIEAITGGIDELRSAVEVFLDGSGARRLMERIASRQQRVDDMSTRFEASMRQQIRLSAMRVDDRTARFRQALTQRVRLGIAHINDLERRLPQSMVRHILMARNRVDQSASVCQALDPRSSLRRGFALVERDGRVLRADEPLIPGEQVTIRRNADISAATISTTTSVTSEA